MTFSISGYCQRSGMHGVAITTSSICVASRCPWVRADAGAVATQNITDPSLGPLLLDRMAAGESASDAISVVIASTPHIEYRQLTAIDRNGTTATYTGEQTLGTHAVSQDMHCVAAGNLLSTPDVASTMTQSFCAHPELHLAERLLKALQSGVDAGGEQGPTHSSGIKVAHVHSWPLVDLRIDWSDNCPVGELMQLWQAYEPQLEDYTTRAVNPAAAPSYGVPGDQ